MLHIILLILKIIGVILGAILGIIVLLLLLALLLPLRYNVAASFPGTIEGIKADVRVSFFLHLISGRASYRDQQFTYRFRAAFKKWDSETAEAEEEAVHSTDTEEPISKKEKPLPIETKEEIPSDVSKKVDPKADKQEHKERHRKKKAKKKSFFKIGKNLYQKFLSLIERIKYTFHNFCAKIKVLLKKKETLERFIENETHKNAFTKVKREFFHVLKLIKPKKMKAKILFGFEDPYLTGKTLAGASIIYPFIGGCTDITPDFERAVLEGDLYIRGNLRMIYFVIPALHLLFDKNIRRTYKHIKNLKL